MSDTITDADIAGAAASAAAAGSGSNVALQPVSISADGSALLQHTDESGVVSESSGSVPFAPSAAVADDPIAARQALLDFFEVESTARFIGHARARRIALQFPDEWLTQSAQVLDEIRARLDDIDKQEAMTTTSQTGAAAAAAIPAAAAAAPLPLRNFYILADTSYGSCCVDEVAAQHANCDLIVHYGFSCLSSTRRLPVRYVFGRKQLDCDQVCKKVFDDAAWAEEDDSSSFSFSSAPAAPVVPAADQPPVLLLFLYSLEFTHAVSSGALPRSIQQALAARIAAADPAQSRQFIVSVAQVDVEQASTPGAASASSVPSASSKCGSGACGCKSQSAGAAAAVGAAAGSCASGSACACSSGACAAPSAGVAGASDSLAQLSLSPSVSVPATASSSTSSPLVFSSGEANGGVPAGPLSFFALNGFRFAFPSALVDSADKFRGVQCVWLGDDVDHKLLVNCMLNFNAHKFHLLNSATMSLRRDIKGQSRTLARRYFLMEKAKNAEIIGILVGTLGVANYLSVIRHLQSLIRGAGKKSYLFVVGKLNEPKLSNFGEVDLFVLVACPLNSMFDSAGYYRDVVTPFELSMAIRGDAWTGDYSTTFDVVLPSAADGQAGAGEGAAGQMDGGATRAVPASAAPSEWLNDDLESGVRFDPVTGKMRSALPSHLAARGIALEDETATPAGALLVGKSSDANSGGELVRVDGGALVHVKNASDHFLNQRSFQGLLLRHEGERGDEIAQVEQGLDGIARSYTQTNLKPADKQVQAEQVQGDAK